MLNFSFANPENHMIHVVFPKFRINKTGAVQELAYLMVGAVCFFVAFSVVPLLIMFLIASMGWTEILLGISGFFTASIIFAGMFRLAVVTHTRLEKPLNWIVYRSERREILWVYG